MTRNIKRRHETRAKGRFRFLVLSLVCLIVGLLTSPTAWAEQNVFIRPFTGISYSKSNGTGGAGFGYQAGLRLMLSANKRQSYGLEISYLDLYGLENNGPDIRYTAVGLVIEQIRESGFLMSIGTLGYIGMGDNSGNPFGIRSKLGWEPRFKNGVLPFIVYRGDLIFDTPTRRVNALSVGLRIRF